MRISADSFLKTSIGASFLIAAMGVSYYYGIHLPAHDAFLDQERHDAQIKAEEKAKQEARVNEARRLEEDQRREEQRVADEAKREEEKVAAERRRLVSAKQYDTCMSAASRSYLADWTGACKLNAQKIQRQLDNCVTPTATRQYCENIYGKPNPNSDCALPTATADGLEKTLNTAKDRCLKEKQAGI